jgi:hypothetical protein
MRRYHHIGIPTTEAKPGETHLKHLKLFVVSHEKSEFGVEWMRFEADAAAEQGGKKVVHKLQRRFRTNSPVRLPIRSAGRISHEVCGKPTFLISSWNRGSERRASSSGSTSR